MTSTNRDSGCEVHGDIDREDSRDAIGGVHDDLLAALAEVEP